MRKSEVQGKEIEGTGEAKRQRGSGRVDDKKSRRESEEGSIHKYQECIIKMMKDVMSAGGWTEELEKS
jgi:TPP-dependent pyruvate/acetoin dehydrogenase alpha subunit